MYLLIIIIIIYYHLHVVCSSTSNETQNNDIPQQERARKCKLVLEYYKNNHKIEIKRKNSILRINYQRDFIKKSLETFSPEDIVFYSDNDEIPNLSDVNFDKILDNLIIFNQKLFYYKFNLHLPQVEWYGTKGCAIKNLKSITW